ncbi:hypothetical protein PINS_up014420 [Pythium insidiosum]|nr:hypothetical protein PINS_up014420 [Pythium insidiosum]
MAAAITPNASFVYDGTSSDLAQQFYRLHTQGTKADALPFKTTDLPTAVQKRLAAGSSYKFEELPGLLQRALLWDTGYTRTFKDDGWVEVRTMNGVSMAEIAISTAEFKSATCTPQYCKQPDGKPWDKSLYCTGAQMLTVARCATSALKDEGIDYSMWATGGDPKAIPEVSAIRHKWTDDKANVTYTVNALHTLPERMIPRWNFCVDSSNTAVYGSIVIPCHPMDRMNASLVPIMKTPKTGALVTAWLQAPFATMGTAVDNSTAGGNGTSTEQTKSGDGFNMVLIIPIVVGVLLVAFIGVWLYRRKRAPASSRGRLHDGDEISGDYDQMDGYSGGGHRTKGRTTMTGTNNTTWSLNTTASSQSTRPSLWDDPTIAAIRIPLDKITIGPLVSRGGFGEVYRGVYKGQDVAIKSLLPERRRDIKQIENFLDEVKLIAGLEHERIVRFIGVAWESLSDLCAVTEFMAGGDLRSMLQRFDEHNRPIGFDHDKVKMALHIAHALTYLHSLQPVVLHRDLKSKNVLLSEEFDAKLTGLWRLSGTCRPHDDCGRWLVALDGARGHARRALRREGGRVLVWRRALGAGHAQAAVRARRGAWHGPQAAGHGGAADGVARTTERRVRQRGGQRDGGHWSLVCGAQGRGPTDGSRGAALHPHDLARHVCSHVKLL